MDEPRSLRLDRLPYTRRHHRLLLGSGVGWALDAMDIGLISFIMVALVAEWSPSDTELSLLGSIGFMGMALGASLGGILADKFGRRTIFAATMLVYGIATGLSALSTGIAMLIALRFLVGMGLGAELPVASTLVSEFAPRRIRGRMVVALESFWAIGWLAAALIGYFVIPTLDGGWRWALALGALPALWSLVVRLGLPESVRFLEAQGREDNAEQVVRSFETSPAVFAASPSTRQRPTDAGPAPATPIADLSPLENTPLNKGAAPSTQAHTQEATSGTPAAPSLSTLFSTRFRTRTLALSLVWFGVNFAYYGAFIWLPTLLHQGGMDVVKSFEFVLYMTLAQLPGYAAAAFLIEKWGRKATLVAFLAGSAVSAVLFGLSPIFGNGFALLFACALSFFNLGAWGALYALTPEVFPTVVRASGAGLATAVGRVAAMLAPLLVPVVNAVGGLGVLFTVFAAMFALAAVGSALLPEFRGKALENA